MTAIGKGMRVVCVRDHWEDHSGERTSGPSIDTTWTVVDACDLSWAESGIWLHLDKWPHSQEWFHADNFRPVDQIDEMAEHCAKREDPDAVDEKYMEVEKVQ